MFDLFAQANLQPNQAVQALTDRIKRITKINIEIADWLQVRLRMTTGDEEG
jgi:F-BAR domain only protein